MNVVSEYVTIYGEAPGGAHEAEPRWIIWKETKDESGRITTEYAQDGANTLRWIYNTVAFDPVPNLDGTPYAISLDNNIVYDGMGAGLPVANISVLDIDDITHTLAITYDPYAKFTLVGNVLTLAGTVNLVDIAYPIKIRATDDEGKDYDQWFAIYVQDPAPTPAAFTGELNVFEEDAAVASGATVTLITYTVPAARELRMRGVEVFGRNVGNYTIELDGDLIARKETTYVDYNSVFDFENYELVAGQVLTIKAQNLGDTAEYFNARLRGYQYGT